MANALRVLAMAEMASGEKDHAAAHWNEARDLYEDAGVADGVVEAERRVAMLAAA